MRKCYILIIMIICLISDAYPQKVNGIEGKLNSKVDTELQADMNSSTKSDELFRVIIVMKEQYNDLEMTRKTQYMNKKEKRKLVIDEMQRFTKSSQADVVIALKNAEQNKSLVDLNQFWIFNGISCSVTKDMIEILSERSDIEMIVSDKLRNMLPEEWNPKPVVPTRGNAWNITKVNADDVWVCNGTSGYTGAGVIVALIDSGVNYNHTDIANNMWDGGADYPHHGYDWCNKDNDPMDDHGHGTHCAGTIAGYGTNGTQTGIAPNAKIMVLKTLGPNGGYNSDAMSAIQFALLHGADVLSMSLGSSGIGGCDYYRKVMEVVNTSGMVASVAAGNDGKYLVTPNPNTGQSYPIPYNIGAPGNCPPPWLNPDQADVLSGGKSAVVSVGATDANDVIADFSSYGPATWATGDYIGSYNDYSYTAGSTTDIGLIRPDVSAPGVNITSLNFENNIGYCSKSGTSMATPCTAGVMALMLEANPVLTAAEIDSILETTAVKCGGFTKKNNRYGAGRIDALAAIQAVLNSCAVPSNLTAIVDGKKVNLTWTAATSVNSYAVYCDGSEITTVTGRNYTDVNVTYGTHAYYLRSKCNGGGFSPASNTVTVTVAYPGRVVSDFNATLENNNVSLSWAAPSTETAILQYGNTSSYGFGNNGKFFWGQKFTPDMLSSCAGMGVNQVSFHCNGKGYYTLCIYEDGENAPSTLLHTQKESFTDNGIKNFNITTPIEINNTKNLWIILSVTAVDVPAVYGSYTGNPNACYYSNDSIHWLNNGDASWRMSAVLTDGTYTYNVYRNDIAIANDLITTSYDDNDLHDGTYSYYVKTNYYGKESDKSNEYTFALGVYTSNGDENWSNQDWINGNQTPPNEYTDVVVNSDVHVDGDYNVKDLMLYKDKTLTIDAGKSLKINGNLYDNGGNIIVKAAAPTRESTSFPNVGSLLHNTSGISGTVECYMDNSGDNGDQNSTRNWHFISSPVASQTIQSFIPLTDYDFYCYQESDYIWINYKASDFANVNGSDFVIGKGYLAAYEAPLGETSVTKNFSGVFNQGEVNVSLSYTDQSVNGLAGFNLVGNPYPSTIDWDAASGWGRDILGLSPSFWIYNEDMRNYGVYQAGSQSGTGTNGATRYIAAGQGFFVKTTGNGTLTMNDAVRVANTGNFMKGGKKNESIHFVVESEYGADEVALNFGSGEGIGAEKLFCREKNSPSLYLKMNNECYSIVNQRYNMKLTPMKLYFKAGASGFYALKMSGIESGKYVELEDVLAGEIVNLYEGQTYMFAADTEDVESRFIINFKEVASDDTEISVFAYINKGMLYVENISGVAEIEVIDIQGRMLGKYNASGSFSTNLDISKGVYLIRVLDEKGLNTQKVVLY